MSVPVMTESAFGCRTTYEYTQPFKAIDFDHMAGILDDATINKEFAQRWIHDSPPCFRIIVTSTESHK